MPYSHNPEIVFFTLWLAPLKHLVPDAQYCALASDSLADCALHFVPPLVIVLLLLTLALHIVPPQIHLVLDAQYCALHIVPPLLLFLGFLNPIS